MAEHISTQPTKRTQRCIDRYEAIANEKWIGGLPAMFAEYQARQITLRDIIRKVGIDYRAVQRLFAHHRIAFRETKDAGRLARKLNPAWNEHISRAKLLHSFRHPDHVTAAAREKRMKLFREHPERHANAHASMTARERDFADLLESLNIPYHFNHHCAGYWLDFFLPAQCVGVEVQKVGRVPTEARDRVICQALNLHTIIYVPNTHFNAYHRKYLNSLLLTIIDHAASIASIGDSRHLVSSPLVADTYWFGFGFKNRWGNQAHDPAPPTNAGSNPNPNPGIGGTVGNVSDS